MKGAVVRVIRDCVLLVSCGLLVASDCGGCVFEGDQYLLSDLKDPF